MIFFRIFLIILFPIAFVVDVLLLLEWFYSALSGSHVGDVSFFRITRWIVRKLKGEEARVDNSGLQRDAAPAVMLRENEGIGSEEESIANLHQEIGPRWVRWVVWSVVAIFLVFVGYVLI